MYSFKTVSAGGAARVLAALGISLSCADEDAPNRIYASLPDGRRLIYDMRDEGAHYVGWYDPSLDHVIRDGTGTCLTYCDERDNWGVNGVDLAALPPKLYGLCYKLMLHEHHPDWLEA